MTTASFFKENGKFKKFSISGHSGYASEGSDIVCAAVSSMVMLTVNNITNSFSLPADVSVEEESATVTCCLKTDDERGVLLITGLYNELCNLVDDYPKYIRVIVK
ncbi:MAG: ribosomal-processing cysteine protease Prp [Ruminococcaceae bacterium]|nr:ribosomal-processing cysteine protease Prp [Oscillospiraceae bacterium]